MRLLVGLGNPGTQYRDTRHNIGFMVVERFATRVGIALKKKGHQGLYGVGRFAGQEILILLPQTYMNRSGVSIQSACHATGSAPGDLIIVHDEIDLPYGTLRVKVGGGHGGHNGLRSIVGLLGTGEFARVRIGVGRPAGAGEVADHVLSPFSGSERRELENVLENSVAAVELLLQGGAQQAMNEFNNRDLFN